MATLRILIAEDESLNALALRSQLEVLGHQVVASAKDGWEAVEIARSVPIDLAIMDIRMPGLSGLEAAEEIVRERPIPVILLTGYSDPEFVAQATLTPVFQYLVKPVSMEDLAPAIAVARSRFADWERFRGEATMLGQKLEEQKLVDRAKAVIMEMRGVSESGAYRVLQRESEIRNQPLAEIARTVLMAESILRDVVNR